MRKIHRGSSPAEGEPLSAGRVEYLEAARQRARSRRCAAGPCIVAVLTVLVLFATARWAPPLPVPRIWWTVCTSP